MLRRLAFNTGLSAITYFLISVVGLVLLPLLINEYGIAVFGIIVLARLFLPSAGLGLLDIGFGEVSILAVAQARSTGAWEQASRYLAIVALTSIIFGIAAGGAMILLAQTLAAWFDVRGELGHSFAMVLVATGFSLPVLFLGLVVEGVLKGYEHFGYQRGCELIGTAVYAIGVLYCVADDRPFEWVCYAQLAAQALRTGFASAALLAIGAHRDFRMPAIGRADIAFVYARCRIVLTGRFLGTMQSQAPPLIIGAMINPAAVGLYDVLVRLPRFAKSVLGLIANTLLPSAIRLSSAGDGDSHQRLSEGGLLAILVLLVPCLAAGIFYSEPILRLWIGPGVSQHWWWQGIMFVVPVLTVITTYGTIFVFDQPALLMKMTRLAGIQLIIHFIVALALLPWLQERAFILGHVIGALVVFAPQVRVIMSVHGKDPAMSHTLLRAIALLATILMAISFVGSPGVPTLPILAILAGAFVLAYAVCTWILILNRQQRALLRMAAAGLGRRRE